MFVLRYAALAALAVWVGGLVLLLLTGESHADLARALHRTAVVCGAAVVIALTAMKLLGPPPAAFPLRVLVAGAMFAIAILSDFAAARFAPILTAVNAAAGLFLLSFYARE